MGYQVTGLEGTITSWGSGSSDWHNHLIAVGTAPTMCRVAVNADEIDKTSIGASANRSYRTGLRSWTVSGESIWPRSTPYLGAGGFVTYASGYTQHLKGWGLNLAWDVFDVTEMNTSNVVWRSFRPAIRGKFTGTYRGLVDSGTALAMPDAWTASSAAATLKLAEDGTHDNTFAGNIISRQLNVDVPIQGGQLDTYDYAFTVDGALTVSSATNPGTNVFPTTTGGSAPYTNVLTFPPYDNSGDGTPNKTILITLATGRTLSGTAFLSSVNITCDVDQQIRVSWTAQGTGALASA